MLECRAEDKESDRKRHGIEQHSERGQIGEDRADTIPCPERPPPLSQTYLRLLLLNISSGYCQGFSMCWLQLSSNACSVRITVSNTDNGSTRIKIKELLNLSALPASTLVVFFKGSFSHHAANHTWRQRSRMSRSFKIRRDY